MVTAAEWDDKSKRGEVCGVLGCGEKATSRCPDCSRHYCYLHIKIHGHIMTDKEVEEQSKSAEQLK